MAIVEFGKMKVELRSATNADARARERIVATLIRRYKVDEDGSLIFHFRMFGRLNTQGYNPENLPFPLSREMTEDETARNWECFDQMPEGFTDGLWSAFVDLLRPADEATGPEPLTETADPKAGRGGK